MEQYDRAFEGVWIEKNIWLNPNLSAIDKVMLAEIKSLDGDNHCFANNEHFAKFCQVSIPTVTRSIKKLNELGLINVFIDKSKGNKRIIVVNRDLINLSMTSNQIDYTSNQNDETSNQFDEHNNTKNNTNTKKTVPKGTVKESTKRFVPPTLEEVKEYCASRNSTMDPEYFFDYYTANGWVQGKGKPIKNWKACIHTWERNEKTYRRSNNSPSKPTIEINEKFREGMKDIVDWGM